MNNQPKVGKVEGFPGVTISVTVTPDRKFLNMELTDERISEMKTIVDRALNTWDKRPEWAVDLSDLLYMVSK